MTARTFRLFVCSTFADLEAERNRLQEFVFPRLQRLCLAAGCRFQAVDLRWGISEEAALDQQTMRVCLEEIERCLKVTPRPNFIVLLGDRYGWRPPPAEIPAAEWTGLLRHIRPPDRELVKGWYRLDANDLPPRYRLRPRTGDAVATAVWAPIEARLQATLAAAADAIADGERRIVYTGSATEQEIVAGVLGTDDAAGRVFCFFRPIVGSPGDGSASRFVEPRAQARRQLEQLKEALRRFLPDGVYEYPARWAGQGPGDEHLKRLGEDVHATLARVITTEIARAEQADPLEAEDEAHWAFAEERARFFTGRAEELRRVREYLTGRASARWPSSGNLARGNRRCRPAPPNRPRGCRAARRSSSASSALPRERRRARPCSKSFAAAWPSATAAARQRFRTPTRNSSRSLASTCASRTPSGRW